VGLTGPKHFTFSTQQQVYSKASSAQDQQDRPAERDYKTVSYGPFSRCCVGVFDYAASNWASAAGALLFY
jgi:hypothetical protein